MDKARDYEKRLVTNLRVHDFSLALFTPYTLKEIEAFLAQYEEDREQPIVVSLGGYVLQGRKRYEAARYRAFTDKEKKKVELACVVFNQVRDNHSIYRQACELMVEDREHENQNDIRLARMMLTYNFPPRVTLLRDILREGTEGEINSHVQRLRQKVYGSPIVSYETRRLIEEGALHPNRAAHLIPEVETKYGGGRNVAVHPRDIPTARRFLDRAVEAIVKGEEPVKVKPVRKRAPKTKELPKHTPASHIAEIWKNTRTQLRDYALKDLLTSIDPAFRPLYTGKLDDILERMQRDLETAVGPVLDTARKQVYALRRNLERHQGISLGALQNPLLPYYERLELSPLDEEVSPAAALDTIRDRYRKMMHRYHPDKEGGSGVVAAAVNEAYERLRDHWTAKELER